MKKMLKKKPTNATEVKEEKRIVPKAPHYEQRWLEAGLEKEENVYGVVYKKVIRYPKQYKHGNMQLNGLQHAIMKWLAFHEQHPLMPVEGQKLLFFDTETTGLKGAGTLIFLLGLMEEQEDAFVMTQYVLPGPDHEPAFLYATNLWKERVTLVSYNGKSFDVPQLQTRWTMNRNSVPPLLEHDHIDLLHGARRVWKEVVDSFKLTKMEETQLHFHREGDIPGHLAPVIYQDAVKSGNPEHLMKVLRHNEWDILSLVTLYIRATTLILERDTLVTAIPHTNIGKWFADLKFYEDSADIFERVIQKYGANHPMTHYHYGFILKRNGKFNNAIDSFAIAANQLIGRERIIALEEIAKIEEHKTKQLANALARTKEAIRLIRVDEELTRTFRQRMLQAFQKREMRLERKIFPGQA